MARCIASYYFLQVLYEYVFLHGDLDEPFTILHVHPHQEVPLSNVTTVESLQLGSAFVLVIVQKENSPDLLSCIELQVN